MAKTRRIGRSAAAASEPPSAPPFRFRGKRLTFLEAYNDQFDSVCEEGRWRSFWREITHAYWLRFPWRLSMDLDPHCSMDCSEPHGKAEFNEMIAIRIATETRIKRYFFHQRHVRRRRATQLAAATAAAAAATPATIATPATAAATAAAAAATPATVATTATAAAPTPGPAAAADMMG
ncbi:hypothetical protein K438DRAFT_1981886 [Mycena galopus ATCC 62051]|nr:hypothetical protein K438DRAFT_1981886 [Mycena galopus ATCC 62051]